MSKESCQNGKARRIALAYIHNLCLGREAALPGWVRCELARCQACWSHLGEQPLLSCPDLLDFVDAVELQAKVDVPLLFLPRWQRLEGALKERGQCLCAVRRNNTRRLNQGRSATGL